VPVAPAAPSGELQALELRERAVEGPLETGFVTLQSISNSLTTATCPLSRVGFSMFTKFTKFTQPAGRVCPVRTPSILPRLDVGNPRCRRRPDRYPVGLL